MNIHEVENKPTQVMPNFQEETQSAAERNRSFENVKDPELRKYLEGFYNALPTHEFGENGLPNMKIIWLPFSYEGSNLNARPADIQGLHNKIIISNIIERKRHSVQGNAIRTFFSEDAVLGFAALVFHTAPYSFRLYYPNSRRENVTELIKKLGDDPIASLISPPDEKSKDDSDKTSHNKPHVSKYVYDKDPKENEMKTSYASPREYLFDGISKDDLKLAKSWTKEFLDQQIPNIRNEMGLASFTTIPYDIARIVITITALKERVNKSPSDIMDDLTYAMLRDACIKVSKLMKDPRITNLSNLTLRVRKYYENKIQKVDFGN